jgi:uncharacterized membrane protein YfhO
MVISERFHPGWRLQVVPGSKDVRAKDTSHEICQVNGDFMGVVVEPGTHVLALKFAPSSLYWGKLTTLVGAIILGSMACALIAVNMYRKSKLSRTAQGGDVVTTRD